MSSTASKNPVSSKTESRNCSGLDLSQEFINSVLLPLLQHEIPEQLPRLAVAVVGTGSDVLGLDDEISRDHHWGPRANVMYVRQDAQQMEPLLKRLFQDRLPDTFCGYDVQANIANMTGVCCCTVEGFFEKFLGTDRLPETDLDWVNLCEVDLFHVTAGKVLYDGLGELTRRREALSYYPENVWKKRIADWCMYVAGRDAPYNIHRVSKRNDEMTSTMYLAYCLKRSMEMCFALNRQYAPYTKWLNRTFRALPKYAADVAPLLDQVIAEPAWIKRVKLLIESNYVIADALTDMQLTKRAPRREFDDGLTDLTLYDSAAQIYSTIPEELFAPSFNQIELWEKMAREVLFDTNDYFHHVNNNQP